ncbi:MAG: DUF4091 domain-containing protein [Fibrobacteria bacterium]|nr:DUF4091 domain-containing protein [Fibrobacteria bacterium]
MNKATNIRIILILLTFTPSLIHADLIIWANNGQDKVTQDELRATTNAESVINSVWDGSQISVFGAKNEVIAFNVILESPVTQTDNIRVTMSSLQGPHNFTISGKALDTANLTDELFDFNGRNIELFYIRYLQIKGLSLLSYGSTAYDERHTPKRFQRPIGEYFIGQGTWYDRPDHDKFYPEIAVPLELHTPFSIAPDSNQSIWIDIFIPKTALAGEYTGTISIYQGTNVTSIPVQLSIKAFTLPDIPTAKTMVHGGNIRHTSLRYVDDLWPNPGSPEYEKMEEISIRHAQIGHRHKISLLRCDASTPQNLTSEAKDQLTGELFTSERGYDGPGIGTGVNVLSIGTYGSWRSDWFADASTEEEERQAMWENADAWVNWFTSQNIQTPTEYFLYLIDESTDYEQTEKWAGWLKSNPGPGKALKSFATIRAPAAISETPSLNIASCWSSRDVLGIWDSVATHFISNPDKKLHFYNGARKERGSFATEDEGISLRVTAWAQFKKKIDRWFFWHATYYNDSQSGSGQTNVFRSARTYGVDDHLQIDDAARGRTGWNYSNGDGVLLYPGTDIQFPEDNYGVNGPFASLRLKLWRRGIQDADYLALASSINPTQTEAIINRIIPKVLWEYGAGEVSSQEDPTWVKYDISWSYDPDVWETARLELADIIEQGQSNVKKTTHTLSPSLSIPNPFYAHSTLSYSLSEQSPVSIQVYDSKGVRVNTLVDHKDKNAGIHSILWDGKNRSNQPLTIGVYYVSLRSGTFVDRKKLVLFK